MVLHSITNVHVLSYFFIGLSGFGVVDVGDEAVDTVVTFVDAGLAEDVGADVKTGFSVGFEMSLFSAFRFQVRFVKKCP